jgi:hypothetical protein
MTFFIGCQGNVRLRRRAAGVIASVISSADVNTSLNRIGFDGSEENLLTGDRVEIETEDARGLVCFAASAWSEGAVQGSISAYVNVNAAGGLRFFNSFADAVNNVRANELITASFAGADIPISVTVRDVSYNLLGNVNNFSLNTDREQVDTTALSDSFRKRYSAGLISGSGTIECSFDYATSGVAEAPLYMLQLLQRLELGSEFDCALYITDKANNASLTSVYYEFPAMVARAGIAVQPGQITNATIDFVTIGEIALKVGQPTGYVLKEDDDRIKLEQSLEFLLQETED